MRRVIINVAGLLLLLCLAVSCATAGNDTASAEMTSAVNPEPGKVEEKPSEEIPKNQIVFAGDEGKLKLVLSKDDMSAKLYKFGNQVKEGFWTSASIGYGANLQIFIDRKPANLFLDPITNEYSIDMTFDGTHDVMRCDFNSWFGKCRKFNALEESSGEIICYGASNFAYWTMMERDLSPYLVHNHSVGGVTDKQLLDAAPELLYPYNPKVVMLLTGSNDYANITDVSDADSIVASMMEFKEGMFEEFHRNLPDARIVVVGGMPTPKRAMYTPLILRVNELIEQYCAQHPDYMTYCSMDGFSYDEKTDSYCEEYFLADGLHLTPEARIIVANDYILPVLEMIDAPKGPVVMAPQTVKLYASADEIPFFDGKADEPWFDVYQVESDKPTKALIIFHGGGFIARSIPKESTDIAEYFSREHGYTCFACYYRINTDYRGIVSDGIRFVKYIRANAEKYNIDPNQICLVGFSAGGSLALMESQHYQDEEYKFNDELADVSGRPDYLCLLYPGSSFMNPTKNRFFKNDYSEELAAKYNPETNIADDMGPVFIAQAVDDATTPIDGTRAIVSALKKKGIDYEFHEFSHGDHGFALGNNEETVTWMELFADWFNKY
ncbi:MAG: alpha/beta hydrolase fold domain-containing protein [Sphaerochaetaceae bacterium]|nr:alpha/beta hydrolase fold domain-containing protein [Sphaerochaetaceae bacterium]